MHAHMRRLLVRMGSYCLNELIIVQKMLIWVTLGPFWWVTKQSWDCSWTCINCYYFFFWEVYAFGLLPLCSNHLSASSKVVWLLRGELNQIEQICSKHAGIIATGPIMGRERASEGYFSKDTSYTRISLLGLYLLKHPRYAFCPFSTLARPWLCCKRSGLLTMWGLSS